MSRVIISDQKGENRKDVNILTDSNGINRLAVDTSATITVSDLQIGAVEIKDQNSNLRMDVVDCSGFGASLTRDCVEYAKTKINNFGSALINPSSTVTLTSYVVPVGKRFIFKGGIIGGDEYGEFYFIVDGNTIALARNSGVNRTVLLGFLELPEAGAGSVIEIKAKNIGSNIRQFEATLSGYILSI